MHAPTNTTEIFLVAMGIILTVPYLIWRIGRTSMPGESIRMRR
mgnify:CR=1 FL=1